MRADGIVVMVTLLWVGVRSAHIISKRQTEFPMLTKMNEISQHLRELTASMAEFQTELSEAVTVDRQDWVRAIPRKRSTIQVLDVDNLNCRLSLHADFCDALEILKERDTPGYLSGPLSPGKRNSDSSPLKYRRIVDDLRKRRATMGSLHKLFSQAGDIIEREKKWFACTLNLGATCQTEEYNKFADYFDFVNSPNSPGKKRAAIAEPVDVTA